MYKYIFIFLLSWRVSDAFPMRLLKTPKIYNALITTNQKLVPSEAVPASTGPVFQPLGLTGDPVLLNPEAFAPMLPADTEGEAPRPFSRDGKPPVPVVFYPRFNIYHQLPQSVYPYQSLYQPPPIVVPVQRSSETKPPQTQPSEIENSEESSMPPTQAEQNVGSVSGFITNNSPGDSNIPNVPPPPPPVGAPQQQADEGSS